MTAPIEFNREFAWANGFPNGFKVTGFENRKPDTQSFMDAVKSFQSLFTDPVTKKKRLIADGMFGTETKRAFEAVYGPIQDQFVYGYDVSSYQPADKFDHRKMYAAGYRFAGIKVGQGPSGKIAKDAKKHVENALNAGMDVFGYFFAEPDVTVDDIGAIDHAQQQAEAWSKILHQLPEMQLLPAFDYEDKGYDVDDTTGAVKRGQKAYDLWKNDRPLYKHRMSNWARVFINDFTSLVVCPQFYAYPSFINSRMERPEQFKKCPLWLSSRTTGYPHTVQGWSELSIQQFTSEGDTRSRSVWPKGLDLNRAPWGLDCIRRK